MHTCLDCGFVDVHGDFDKCQCGGDNWFPITGPDADAIRILDRKMRAKARIHAAAHAETAQDAGEKGE